MKELCAFWPCGSCVFLWDCLWASGGLPVASQHFVGNRVLEAQDDAFVGVIRLLPSSLAYGPLRILNEHFRL